MPSLLEIDQKDGNVKSLLTHRQTDYYTVTLSSTYYFRPFRPIVIVIIGQIPKEVIHVFIVSAVLMHYNFLGRIYKRGKNISKFKLDKKNPQFITSNTSQVMFKLLMISYSLSFLNIFLMYG